MLAILGLRALYFVLAGAIVKLYYLRTGLSAILIFVGAMLAAPFYKLPVAVSLLAILSVLAAAVGASLRRRVVTSKNLKLEFGR